MFYVVIQGPKLMEVCHHYSIASKVVLRFNESAQLGDKDVFWIPETKFNF